MTQITNRHLAARMLEHASWKARSFGTPPDGGRPPGDDSSATALPEPHPLPARSLYSIIESRRSGDIVKAPVSDSALASLLDVWHQPLPAALAPAPALCPTAYTVVLDVTNVAAGAYRYDPDGRRLLPIRPVSRAMCRRDLLLQSEHANAAVVIFTVVPLTAWMYHAGDRGYRNAAMQAGWVADQLYLRSEALSLTYTASGGFSPMRADELLGLDGRIRTALFSFVVGGARR